MSAQLGRVRRDAAAAAAAAAAPRVLEDDVGVELKGVSRSSKAPRAGIESEVWAERCAGKSP